MIWAKLDFPVPGGPHKIREILTFCSIIRRRGFPLPSKSCWPTTSFSVCGRILSARGVLKDIISTTI